MLAVLSVALFVVAAAVPFAAEAPSLAVPVAFPVVPAWAILIFNCSDAADPWGLAAPPDPATGLALATFAAPGSALAVTGVAADLVLPAVLDCGDAVPVLFAVVDGVDDDLTIGEEGLVPDAGLAETAGETGGAPGLTNVPGGADGAGVDLLYPEVVAGRDGGLETTGLAAAADAGLTDIGAAGREAGLVFFAAGAGREAGALITGAGAGRDTGRPLYFGST